MRVPGQHAESGRDQTALTFVRLALALANDYQIVYVIRIADDSYVEYAAEGSDKTLVRRSAGEDFYRDTVLNGRIQVMPEDQARFLSTLRKENVLAAVQDGATFTLHYRLINSGTPLWHSLKAVRGAGEDSQYVIIGVPISTRKNGVRLPPKRSGSGLRRLPLLWQDAMRSSIMSILRRALIRNTARAQSMQSCTAATAARISSATPSAICRSRSMKRISR